MAKKSQRQIFLRRWLFQIWCACRNAVRSKNLGWFCTKRMVCAEFLAKNDGRSRQKAAQTGGNEQLFCVEWNFFFVKKQEKINCQTSWQNLRPGTTNFRLQRYIKAGFSLFLLFFSVFERTALRWAAPSVPPAGGNWMRRTPRQE